ncbi:MAG: ABC transporter permease [Treponema sp.]|jgi:ribose transport system permease protein|nr:ABC transporter permease [Treponema sp.]
MIGSDKLKIKILNGKLKTAGVFNWLSAFTKNYAIVLAIVVLGVVYAFSSEYFVSYRNIRNILQQTSPIAVVAIAQALILLLGDFDLSLGQMVCFTSAFAAWMMKFAHIDPVIALPIALMMGGVMGAANGFLIAFCKIPAFVATLGTQLICFGLARIVTKASPISGMPLSIEWLGRGFAGGAQWGVPVSVIIMVLMYVIFQFVSRRTRLGRGVYAIGGGSEAAYFSGINVKTTKLAVFTLSGLIAAFGGLILLSRLDSAAVTNGNQYEFDAIISCVIGGISLSGGKGKITQALFGAIFLTLFFNGMTMMNVHPFIQPVLKGIVLISAVAIDVVRNKR